MFNIEDNNVQSDALHEVELELVEECPEIGNDVIIRYRGYKILATEFFVTLDRGQYFDSVDKARKVIDQWLVDKSVN